MKEPGALVKILFALILGGTSSVCAELPLMHAPYLLFPTGGLLVIPPIYLLHSLFFATLLYHYSSGTYSGLYFSGALIGLYEAFITKVLWLPAGDPVPFRLFGVHWVETVFLVFFWHPFFAFIIPLVVVEATCTRSRFFRPDTSDLPVNLNPHVVSMVVLFVLALIQGAVSPDAKTNLLANAIHLSVLSGLVLVWRMAELHKVDIGDVLPSRKLLPWVGGALLVLYVTHGVTFRTEAYPSRWLPYLPVFGLYVVVLCGLVMSLSTPSEGNHASCESSFFTRYGPGYLSLFVVASGLFTFLPEAVDTVVFLGFYGLTVLLGLVALVSGFWMLNFG